MVSPPPTRTRLLTHQLWVMSETGSLHMACGPPESLSSLGERYVKAGVAIGYELGPCCEAEDSPCSFDMWADQSDQVVLLSWALRRAEGRDLSKPPYRCPCCGDLTYGGCHPEASPYRSADVEGVALAAKRLPESAGQSVARATKSESKSESDT